MLAKAVSKVMFEATGHDPTKPSTLTDGMLLNALNCLKLIAVNMSAEVARLLHEQHELAKTDQSNDEVTALIARIDPLYRILDFVAEEIGHLIGVAGFLVRPEVHPAAPRPQPLQQFRHLARPHGQRHPTPPQIRPQILQSFPRHRPIGSKFSNANPGGSID